MPEWLEKYGEVIKWISGVGGALAVIWAWFARPLKDVRKSLQNVQGMTDFLTGDRLAQAYAYWMRKGYCPQADKERLSAMYDAYHARGLNTLTTKYVHDLLGLPDEAPAKGV